jgi:LmbE family N-acetylglucosaminyl deacetylase
MREKIVSTDADRIAVVAPHPDDECLEVASVLILAPQQTDIYVLTDGSHGNPECRYAE